MTAPFLRAALAESERRGEQFIGPAHLLIATADAAPLKQRNISPDSLRDAIAKLLGPPATLPGPRLMVGPTANAARVLQRAGDFARARGRAANADDLLLALLDDGDPATTVLTELGLSPSDIRRELASG